MKILELTTSKMPKETEQQYTAWLLYCETGSIDKLLRVWDRVGQKADEVGTDFGAKLGAKPARSTLGEWSKRFRWVEREELKLKKDLEELNQKLSRIVQKRKYQIVIAFGEALERYAKQLGNPNKEVTVNEVRILWEMMRVELGEPIGKHQVSVSGIDESLQTPPTPEERELGRALDEAVKEHYRKQGQKRYEEHLRENV